MDISDYIDRKAEMLSYAETVEQNLQQGDYYSFTTHTPAANTTTIIKPDTIEPTNEDILLKGVKILYTFPLTSAPRTIVIENSDAGTVKALCSNSTTSPDDDYDNADELTRALSLEMLCTWINDAVSSQQHQGSLDIDFRNF